MTITRKLTFGAALLTIVAVIISAGSTGFLAQQQSSKALSQSVEQQFLAVAAGREGALQQRFQADSDQLLSLANSRLTQEAVYGFIRPFVSYRYEVETPTLEQLKSTMASWYSSRYQSLYREQTAGASAPVSQWLDKMTLEGLLIQKYYVADNPHSAAQLALMEDRSDASIYGQQHRRYQSSYAEVVNRYGYQDLMLIDASSANVIYSVTKGPVFASSLQNGPFADSALAELVKALQQQPEQQVMVSRFSEFSGFFNRQVVFVGVQVRHPVYSPTKALGYLVIQIPAERFTALMTGNQQWADIGLGQTGEAYLVGADQRLVTELRPVLTADQQLLPQLVQSVAAEQRPRAQALQRLSGMAVMESPEVKQALTGSSGIAQTTDYLGRPVLKAWQPVQLGQQQLALITQQSIDESLGSIKTLQQQLVFSVIIAVVLLGLVAALAASMLAKYLTGPLIMLSRRINQAAEQRDLTQQFALTSKDEVADIGAALNLLFGSFAKVIAGLKQHAELTASSATENVQISQQCKEATLVQQKDLGNLSQDANNVIAAMNDMANQMTQAATQASDAQVQATEGAQSVADVATLMRELAQQVADSGENMQALQAAATDISSVLDTIKGVSEQTNLLALNAAIEAARAGEHGRGFAVVADEVRRLSGSTQEATGQIQQMLNRLMQTVNEASVALQSEQRSAQICVEGSVKAEQILSRIRTAVQAISQATEQVAQVASMENKRVGQMEQSLLQVSHSADMTGEAMLQLATTAQDQEALALKMQQSAAEFRV